MYYAVQRDISAEIDRNFTFLSGMVIGRFGVAVTGREGKTGSGLMLDVVVLERSRLLGMSAAETEKKIYKTYNQVAFKVALRKDTIVLETKKLLYSKVIIDLRCISSTHTAFHRP